MSKLIGKLEEMKITHPPPLYMVGYYCKINLGGFYFYTEEFI